MDAILAKLLGYLEREQAVMRRALFPLLIMCGLGCGLTWWLTARYYKSFYQGTIEQYKATLNTKEQHRAFLQDQLENYKKGQPESSKHGESQEDKTTGQLRLEELQRRKMQPYTIRKADQEEFIRNLKLSGKFSVNIEYSSDDDLAEVFARELATLLRLATWEIKGLGATPVYITGGKPPPGVTVSGPEKQAIPIGADIFMQELRAQEIWVTYKEAPPRKIDPASFDIFVGGKE